MNISIDNILRAAIQYGEQKHRIAAISSWGIKRTEQNYEQVNQFMNNRVMLWGSTQTRFNLKTGYVTSDCCYFAHILPADYTEITTDEFLTHIIKQNTMHADIIGALEQLNTSYRAFEHKGERMTKEQVEKVLLYAKDKGYKTTAELTDEEVDKVLAG